MDRVYIPQLLQQPEQTLTLELDEHLPDLDTLTPVRAEIQITHQATFLTVKGWAETIVTLTCHRCLQNYNHRITIAPKELIWLQADPDPATLPLECEVAVEDLNETLPPTGYFHPTTWIYEQICLALPQRQLCDATCPGIAIPGQALAPPDPSPLDPRWSILAQLQRQMGQDHAPNEDP